LYKLFEVLIEHCICTDEILDGFVQGFLAAFEVFIVANIENHWFVV